MLDVVHGLVDKEHAALQRVKVAIAGLDAAFDCLFVAEALKLAGD
jgi:hypothetical protein